MPPANAPLPVPSRLTRGAHKDRAAWLDSARFIVDLLASVNGTNDLDGVDLLDVGCGTKLVKILLDEGRPIGRYVGVDVSSEVIDWLTANVHDGRFELHHLNAHNDLYNTKGTRLADFERLPIGDRCFDVIGLFSVFTHLAPDDFTAMLRVLRHHIKPTGRLVFSLYADNPDDSPVAQALQARLDSNDPAEAAEARDRITRAMSSGSDGKFVDAVPDQPLLQARYRRDYALELTERSGWRVLSLNPPVPPHIQHYMVCELADATET